MSYYSSNQNLAPSLTSIVVLLCVICVNLVSSASISRQQPEGSIDLKLDSAAANHRRPLNRMLISRSVDGETQLWGRESFGQNDNNQLRLQRLKRSEPTEISLPKYKIAMKKKWHKLVDEIIDDQLEHQQLAANDENKKMDYKKKKSLSNNNKWKSEVNGDDDEKIVIIMKKKPSIDMESNSAAKQQQESMNVASSNMVGLQVTGSDGQPQDRKVPDDHHRRVLNDQFGILKESIFTTNNHLGYKGVPKFGSEEEY